MNTEVMNSIIESLFNKGLDLGGRIIMLLIILFIGLKVVKVAKKLTEKALEKAHAEKSVSTFLVSLVKYSLYGVLAFIIASYCGVDAASIVALLGSIGVAVGLALQGSLSNIAGGVLLLLLRPFNVGDYIIASGHEGVVENIELFFTTLRTGDNRVITLPNGPLANGSIVNVTSSGYRRCDIIVGISYDADIKTAKEVLMNVIESDEHVIMNRGTDVFVDKLGESSVDMHVRCWFSVDEYWAGLARLNENIKEALDENGIEIPYNKLDVNIKNK